MIHRGDSKVQLMLKITGRNICPVTRRNKLIGIDWWRSADLTGLTR